MGIRRLRAAMAGFFAQVRWPANPCRRARCPFCRLLTKPRLIVGHAACRARRPSIPGNCSRLNGRRGCNPLSHGLEPQDSGSNNGAMKIKPTQIYDWEVEPVDERPSEFSASSGYSSASGFYSTAPVTPQPLRHARSGYARLIAAALAVLALGAFALAKLAPLLRG